MTNTIRANNIDLIFLNSVQYNGKISFETIPQSSFLQMKDFRWQFHSLDNFTNNKIILNNLPIHSQIKVESTINLDFDADTTIIIYYDNHPFFL